MPVRTSAVVASGLGLLTVIGVGTIFGDSLVAMVAPPPIETASTVAKTGSKGSPATQAMTKAEPRAPAPVSPNTAAGDAGGHLSPDGSS